MGLEYTRKGNTLQFKDNITTVSDNNLPLDGVTFIDFNNVEHITVDLDLSKSSVESLDLKDVITAKTIILPNTCKVINEDLYWAEHIIKLGIKDYKIISKRMEPLNIYNNLGDNRKQLIYLSGTVVNYLPLRAKQTSMLLRANYAVYSPGQHMTLGDRVADKYPEIVYKLDIKAMEKADIIFFDLTNLSAGTSAELGYSIAKGWYKYKKLVGIYKETQNFFINGLKDYIDIYESIEEFIALNK